MTEQAPRAEIVVDEAAISANLRRLRELMAPDDPALMTVVKADGYGHGLVCAGRAARAGGATWLGVATLDEALALREAGDRGRLLCWLAVPGEDYRPVLARDVDVTASDVRQVDAVEAAARELGVPARLQLKVDTGLSRGGAPLGDWPAVVDRAAAAERAGHLLVTGVWSHFACSEEPEHPANAVQERAFRDALVVADAAGLRPEVRHLANSAAALLRPSARFDLVRLGLASYGLSPAPAVASAADLGLRPAMTVRGRVALTKTLPAGAGVSYGHTFVAERPTEVALVPLGYGDGVPRQASNRAEVQLGGRRARVLGRICMDQFVVEAPGASAGDEVVLFGSGEEGEPSAEDWAQWCETISYEIVTRIGGWRVRHTARTGSGR